MSAPGYRETLLSQVYAGNQHGAATLRASVQATEELLALTPAQRRRTVWSADGGFGSDENLNWLLWRGYQVLSKGYSGKRAKAYARQVEETAWHPLRAGRWVALAPHPPRYGRKTVTLVLHRLAESGEERYATLVSSLLAEDPFTLPARFDRRGAMESEVKTDKGGLLLPKRRKKQLCAQEGLILNSYHFQAKAA